MRKVFLVAVACPLLLAIGVSAQDVEVAAPNSVESLRELVLHARYAEARESAQVLRARTDLSPADRLSVLELLATVQIAERDDASASETLATLFSRDPEFRPDPQASPVVLQAFEAARNERPEPISVTIEHVPPATAQTLVQARITAGQSAVDSVQISYRDGGSGPFTEVSVPLDANGHVEARVGAQPGGTVEYHIAALAPSGAVLSSRGSDTEPLRMSAAGPTAPTERDPTPVTTDSPSGGVPVWVWIAGGAAVLVGTVILVAVLASGSSLPDSTLGEGMLQ